MKNQIIKTDGEKLTDAQLSFLINKSNEYTNGVSYDPEIDSYINAYVLRDHKEYLYHATDIDNLIANFRPQYDNITFLGVWYQNQKDAIADNLHKPLIGIYNTGNHWISFALKKDPQNNITLYIKDSLRYGTHDLINNIKASLPQNTNLTIHQHSGQEQSGNGSACGIFAVENAKILADHINNINDKNSFDSITFCHLNDIPQYRKDLGDTLKKQCIVNGIIEYLKDNVTSFSDLSNMQDDLQHTHQVLIKKYISKATELVKIGPIDTELLKNVINLNTQSILYHFFDQKITLLHDNKSLNITNAAVQKCIEQYNTTNDLVGIHNLQADINSVISWIIEDYLSKNQDADTSVEDQKVILSRLKALLHNCSHIATDTTNKLHEFVKSNIQDIKNGIDDVTTLKIKDSDLAQDENIEINDFIKRTVDDIEKENDVKDSNLENDHISNTSEKENVLSEVEDNNKTLEMQSKNQNIAQKNEGHSKEKDDALSVEEVIDTTNSSKGQNTHRASHPKKSIIKKAIKNIASLQHLIKTEIIDKYDTPEAVEQNIQPADITKLNKCIEDIVKKAKDQKTENKILPSLRESWYASYNKLTESFADDHQTNHIGDINHDTPE